MYTYEDVLEGRALGDGKIIILDDFSNELAPGLALLLAPRVKEVQLVTRWSTVVSDPYSVVSHHAHMGWLSHHKNIKVVPSTFVKEVRNVAVTLLNTDTMEEQVEEA